MEIISECRYKSRYRRKDLLNKYIPSIQLRLSRYQELHLAKSRCLGDGFISNIVNPIVTYYTPLPRGTTKPNGIYTWGAHNNTLTITGSLISKIQVINHYSDSLSIDRVVILTFGSDIPFY